MMELEPTATTFEDFQSRQAAIDALNTEAWACRDADPQRTRDLSLHAQTLAEEAADHGTPYHTGFADALLGQAYANMRLGEHAHAFEQAASARDQYEALSHNERLVEALNILAGTQAYTGLYAEALSTTQTQLALAEQIANPLQTIEAHSNIANLYTLTAQTNLAQEHFTQVVILADSVDDTRARFMARYNFAVALNGFGNHQEALGHARIAEALAVEGASEYLHLLSLGAVGEALLGLGVLGEAQTTLQRSLAGARAANIPFVAAQALIVLGVMAGDTKDGDNALRFLLEALKLSVEHGDPRQQRECYQRLASVYEQQGDCQSALAHANTAHALDRNLFNEAADQRFKLLQVVHATATARRDAESSRRRTAELEHEIAERKKTEAALQRRVSELATLNILFGIRIVPL